MNDWEWDSPEAVQDEDVIYRRIPVHPDHRTADPLNGGCLPSPAAFQVPWKANTPPTGLSGHLDRLVPTSRKPPNLYTTTRFGAVAYKVRIVRAQGEAGVVITDDPLEEDPILRGSHVEVRTPEPRDKRAFRDLRETIISNCSWAQVPPEPCQGCSGNSTDPNIRSACPRMAPPHASSGSVVSQVDVSRRPSLWRRLKSLLRRTAPDARRGA